MATVGKYIDYLTKLLLLWLDPEDEKLLLLVRPLPKGFCEHLRQLPYPRIKHLKEWAKAIFTLYKSQHPGPNLIAGWGQISSLTDEGLLADIEEDIARTLPLIEVRF
jgi:hypothetical protein